MDLKNSKIKLNSTNEIDATLAAYTEHTIRSLAGGDVASSETLEFLDLLNTASCHRRKILDLTELVDIHKLYERLQDFANNTDSAMVEIAEAMSAPFEIEPVLTRRFLGAIASGMVCSLSSEVVARKFAASLVDIEPSQFII